MDFKLLDRYRDVKYLVTRRDTEYGCSFSMALHTGEDMEQILRNRSAVSDHFGKEYSFCGIRQVHGDSVVVIDRTGDVGWRSLESAPRADAAITNLPQVVLTVLTADCVPIMLYDPASKAIGVVHAGWKGSEKNIAAKTVHRMIEVYGSMAEEMVACIAPAIGSCCYEVDSGVADRFLEYNECIQKSDKAGKYRLDLKSVNRQQLLKAGLKDKNIEVSSICTTCSSDQYFSYRKDKASGRFLSALAIVTQDDS